MQSNYGAMRTDDPATDGYYIVEWSSNVYIARDDIVMKGCNPPEYSYAGEIVCEAKFQNLVSKTKYWHIPIPEGESDTKSRMKKSLMADIKLVDISDDNKLPKGCNKKKVK